MTGELVLCVGMHRSGTSLTAGLLQAIGLPLPGNLIAGDQSNPSGYFENRSVVDAQEELLRALGFWWPTENASRGMPLSVQSHPLYEAHIRWLCSYLRETIEKQGPLLAIKDPRTSLLLPAWRAAAKHLQLNLKLVICLRQPRDVCWSLVWRDGPQVGMNWGRAQRLWIEHYRALLRDAEGLPKHIAQYEQWLQPKEAFRQLADLRAFLQLQCTDAALSEALQYVRPEFNHGGVEQLPPIDRSLLELHAALSGEVKRQAQWSTIAQQAKRRLKRHQHINAVKLQLKVLALRTPLGRRQLGPALDRETLLKQLGSDSLRRYRQQFRRSRDLRPHPLISPAYINRERVHCGLPPLESADQLFSHLLNPDLIPLDPHPWFRSRVYQQCSGSIGAAGMHPVISYLKASESGETVPYPAPGWLISLDQGRPIETLPAMPACAQALRPGLVLANPLTSLGYPTGGDPLVIQAHQHYQQSIQYLFKHWPDHDDQGPLTWLSGLAPTKGPGWSEIASATSMRCWWLSSDWAGPLLASLAGASVEEGRNFEQAEALVEALHALNSGDPPVLLAIGPSLLKELVRQRFDCRGLAVVNLCWPTATDQQAWLELLAGAKLILECRPAVRAYLQALGLEALWCVTDPAELRSIATENSQLPTKLARQAAQGEDPGIWLSRVGLDDPDWRWHEQAPQPNDLSSWTLLHWASQHGVALTPAAVRQSAEGA